jgi:hypothetical protein
LSTTITSETTGGISASTRLMASSSSTAGMITTVRGASIAPRRVYSTRRRGRGLFLGVRSERPC